MEQVRCSQQNNGYDCGVYVIYFAEIICAYLSSIDNDNEDMNTVELFEKSAVSPASISHYRNQIRRELIEDINKKK